MVLSRTNKQYKDRLFKFIFGNPENKEWTLSLYNAVNGSNYDNPDDIWYNTIDDAIYMHMKNDVSFIIENTMNLYEQQSTYCPNMPFRFYIYLGKLFETYSQRDDFDMYSSKLQNIPRPTCICFYNGLSKQEDRKILKLSQMYFEGTERDISTVVELEVIMININYGHNKELLEKTRPLYEYSFFVDKIRFYQDEFKKTGVNYTLENAIDRAIDDLPEDFLIREFILKNRMEVKDMCLFEYDEEKHLKSERKEERTNTMLELLHEGLLEKKVVAKKLGITIEELDKKLNNL